MLTCCSFPTESIRIAALLLLLLFEIVWVTKKNRRVALILAAGAAIDLFSAIGVPMLEMVGLYFVGQNNGDPGVWVLGLFTMPMLQRLSMAFHLFCMLVGLVLLTRDLPEEERDGSW